MRDRIALRTGAQVTTGPGLGLLARRRRMGALTQDISISRLDPMARNLGAAPNFEQFVLKIQQLRWFIATKLPNHISAFAVRWRKALKEKQCVV